MIKRILLAAAAALSLSVSSAAQIPCGFNLLQNPGCEQGTAFWIDPAMTWSCQSGPNPLGTTPPAHSGNGYFFAGVSNVAELYQDISLAPYPVGQQFELSGYVSAADQSQSPFDQSQLELQCLDGTGAILASSSTAPVSSVLTWSLQDTGITTVPGSVVLRVVLRATRSQGTNNDGYFDDLYLVALPTAGTGEDNGPGAGLLINGFGPASFGPFFADIQSGSNVTLTMTSAPSSPVVLLIGVLQPCAASLGCSGCLDLVGESVFLSGATDSFGVFSVALPVPLGLDGLGFGLQAAGAPGGSCPFELSASFCVAIQ